MALSRKSGPLDQFHNDPKGFCERNKDWDFQLLEQTKDERHRIGYYTPDELHYEDVPADSVKGIIGNMTFHEAGDYPNVEYIGSSLMLDASADVYLPKCRKITGNLMICCLGSEPVHISLPVCESVDGDVKMYSGSVLDMPVCARIGGCVNTSGYCECSLPECREVGGITMYSNAKIELISCMNITNGIHLENGAELNLPVCIDIGSSIYVNCNSFIHACSLSIPECDSIGGSIVLNSANLDAPVCRTIERDVRIEDNKCNLNLSSLEEITGDLKALEDVALSLHNCQKVGGNILLEDNSKVNLPACKYIGGELTMKGRSQFSAPECSEVEGSVSCKSAKSVDLSKCKTIGEDLYLLHSEATFPSLSAVGGDVKVWDSRLEATKCKRILGKVSVANGNINCPAAKKAQISL